jgi:hypothetical protein
MAELEGITKRNFPEKFRKKNTNSPTYAALVNGNDFLRTLALQWSDALA